MLDASFKKMPMVASSLFAAFCLKAIGTPAPAPEQVCEASFSSSDQQFLFTINTSKARWRDPDQARDLVNLTQKWLEKACRDSLPENSRCQPFLLPTSNLRTGLPSLTALFGIDDPFDCMEIERVFTNAFWDCHQHLRENLAREYPKDFVAYFEALCDNLLIKGFGLPAHRVAEEYFNINKRQASGSAEMQLALKLLQPRGQVLEF